MDEENNFGPHQRKWALLLLFIDQASNFSRFLLFFSLISFKLNYICPDFFLKILRQRLFYLIFYSGSSFTAQFDQSFAFWLCFARPSLLYDLHTLSKWILSFDEILARLRLLPFLFVLRREWGCSSRNVQAFRVTIEWDLFWYARVLLGSSPIITTTAWFIICRRSSFVAVVNFLHQLFSFLYRLTWIWVRWGRFAALNAIRAIIFAISISWVAFLRISVPLYRTFHVLFKVASHSAICLEVRVFFTTWGVQLQILLFRGKFITFGWR